MKEGSEDREVHVLHIPHLQHRSVMCWRAEGTRSFPSTAHRTGGHFLGSSSVETDV